MSHYELKKMLRMYERKFGHRIWHNEMPSWRKEAILIQLEMCRDDEARRLILGVSH